MMKAKIEKCGDSLAIRIPEELARECGFELGKEIELCAVNGELRVVAVAQPHPKLAELAAQITPENRHELVDGGPRVGNEIW